MFKLHFIAIAPLRGKAGGPQKELNISKTWVSKWFQCSESPDWLGLYKCCRVESGVVGVWTEVPEAPVGKSVIYAELLSGGGPLSAHQWAVEPHAHSSPSLLSLLHFLPSDLSFCFLPKACFPLVNLFLSSYFLWELLILFIPFSCLLNYNIRGHLVHFSHFYLMSVPRRYLLHRSWEILKGVQVSFSTFQT